MYAEQYKTNRIYHVHYQKSKDKNGAENMLKRMGFNPKEIDVEKLRSDYNALYSKKQALQKTYKSAGKEAADLNRKLNNLN